MKKQTKGQWIWNLFHPQPGQTVLEVKMDKETALDFCINLYKAVNNQDNESIVWTMEMHNFLNIYKRRDTSNPRQSSDKPS